MTSSTFKARLARLAQTQVKTINRITGSPGVFHLTSADVRRLKIVSGTEQMARRGLTLRRARSVLKSLLEAGRAAVLMPHVEDDQTAFTEAMEAAGITVRAVSNRDVDTRELREQLNLSRDEFALGYNIPVETVEKWENGSRKPDAAALAYLRVIERQPDAAWQAQEERGGATLRVPARVEPVMPSAQFKSPPTTQIAGAHQIALPAFRSIDVSSAPPRAFAFTVETNLAA
jgi:putative transcriptional regulator